MRLKLKQAGVIAVAAMTATVFLTASESGAAAQDKEPTLRQNGSIVQFISEPVIQALPAADGDANGSLSTRDDEADSLAQMVEAQPQPEELSRELTCLAGAIYFEARGESLAGQLAVGRVVVARAKSGRFPDTYCGVVFQQSQFSFVRGRALPAVRKTSKAWQDAVAIAQIAHGGSWESPAEGALFFHATRVSPNWQLTRVARVDNHVFYR